jgi:hypothetical protein
MVQGSTTRSCSVIQGSTTRSCSVIQGSTSHITSATDMAKMNDWQYTDLVWCHPACQLPYLAVLRVLLLLLLPCCAVLCCAVM